MVIILIDAKTVKVLDNDFGILIHFWLERLIVYKLGIYFCSNDGTENYSESTERHAQLYFS